MIAASGPVAFLVSSAFSRCATLVTDRSSYGNSELSGTRVTVLSDSGGMEVLKTVVLFLSCMVFAIMCESWYMSDEALD